MSYSKVFYSQVFAMSRLIDSRENFLWSKGQPPGEDLLSISVRDPVDIFSLDSLLMKRKHWDLLQPILSWKNYIFSIDTVNIMNRTGKFFPVRIDSCIREILYRPSQHILNDYTQDVGEGPRHKDDSDIEKLYRLVIMRNEHDREKRVRNRIETNIEHYLDLSLFPAELIIVLHKWLGR